MILYVVSVKKMNYQQELFNAINSIIKSKRSKDLTALDVSFTFDLLDLFKQKANQDVRKQVEEKYW